MLHVRHYVRHYAELYEYLKTKMGKFAPTKITRYKVYINYYTCLYSTQVQSTVVSLLLS